MIDAALKTIQSSVASDAGGIFAGGMVAMGHLHSEPGASPSGGADAKLWMSLINVAEEPTLKNAAAYRPASARPGERDLLRRSPPAFLNLYVLFASRAEPYADSLLAISALVEHFQANRYLPFAPALPPDTALAAGEEPGRLVVEMVSLSFEQLNHLWGVNGSRYYPSVVYRVRVVPVAARGTSPLAHVATVGFHDPDDRVTPVAPGEPPLVPLPTPRNN